MKFQLICKIFWCHERADASKSSMRLCAIVNDLQRVVSCFTPRLLLPGHEMKGSCKTIFSLRFGASCEISLFLLHLLRNICAHWSGDKKSRQRKTGRNIFFLKNNFKAVKIQDFELFLNFGHKKYFSSHRRIFRKEITKIKFHKFVKETSSAFFNYVESYCGHSQVLITSLSHHEMCLI